MVLEGAAAVDGRSGGLKCTIVFANVCPRREDSVEEDCNSDVAAWHHREHNILPAPGTQPRGGCCRVPPRSTVEAAG
jgi:hypothetical protein